MIAVFKVLILGYFELEMLGVKRCFICLDILIFVCNVVCSKDEFEIHLRFNESLCGMQMNLSIKEILRDSRCFSLVNQLPLFPVFCP